MKPVYTKEFHTDQSQAIGGLFIYAEEVIKVQTVSIKNKLSKKYIKWNKILGCDIVRIGLQSLLPRQSKFALKRSLLVNFVIQSIECFLLFILTNFH